MSLGPSLDEIAQLLQDRQSRRSGFIHTMQAVRDNYNGDVIIPMPEMDKAEKPAVANLIKTGLDQTAMRIASTMPSLYYPPLEDGNNASEKRARIRTQANAGWWEVNNLNLQMRRRARLLIGYSSAPVMIRPDLKWGFARWDIKNPLDVFAPENDDPGNFTPADIITTFTRNRAWLKNRYPDGEAALKSKNPRAGDKIMLAEYNDADVTVLMAISDAKDNIYEQLAGVPYVELERIPNRAGICLAVNPSLISLDRPMGQFDSLLGMYELQAKLMALEVIAVERGIFPDTYLVSRPNEIGKFVSGPHDGRTGNVNIVTGGAVDVRSPVPSQATGQMIDRMERAQRIGGGTPADMTGESASNVRTGKRGDAIMSATIDFNIQEAQEIFSVSLEAENKRAVAIAKTYFGNEKKSFYISTQNFKGSVDYVPNRDFETDNNVVTYSHSGADANALIVGLGQRKGLGMISTETAMQIDPMIADPAKEKDRVIAEQLENTLLQSIQAQAQQGIIPPADLAAIAGYVKTDKLTLAQAVAKVHADAQKRQATAAPAGAPETMPGLGAPGQGAEQPAASPAAAPTIASVLSSLHGQPNATLTTSRKVS